MALYSVVAPQSQTKIEPDLRLDQGGGGGQRHSVMKKVAAPV